MLAQRSQFGSRMQQGVCIAKPLFQAKKTSAVTRKVQMCVLSVSVLGAAGGIGQPLSMLLKMNKDIDTLNLYDIVNTPGVSADLSHIDTGCQVQSFVGKEQLNDSLQGADLVIIPAGVPRKPGMTRDDLFNINAGIVAELADACASMCPGAWVCIISNPVNSTVPIAAEVFKKKGVYNPKKMFGVSTLDCVRARTFWSEITGTPVSECSVPVIGGHAGITILPLLSQAKPAAKLSDDELKALMTRIQNAGTEVVEAKAGAGSATLSMAYAAAVFAESCIKAINGQKDVVECAYVESSVTELPYFASPLLLGPEGIEKNLGFDGLNQLEQDNLKEMKEMLSTQIEKGVAFAKSK